MPRVYRNYCRNQLGKFQLRSYNIWNYTAIHYKKFVPDVKNRMHGKNKQTAYEEIVQKLLFLIKPNYLQINCKYLTLCTHSNTLRTVAHSAAYA